MSTETLPVRRAALTAAALTEYVDYPLPSVHWALVTPEIASVWLDSNVNNRKKRRLHISKIVRDMKAGRFLVTGDSIRFDWDGRLIDGQHRLEAIIESGASIWMLVIGKLDPKVQAVLDAQTKRSGSDALFFHGTPAYRDSIAAVARIALSRESGKLANSKSKDMVDLTNSEVVAWYSDNPDVDAAAAQASKLFREIGAAPSALAYAILITSRLDADASEEFFTSTAEMRTNGRGDPRKTLLDTLRRDKDNRVTAVAANQLSYILRTWNAWREGRELTKLPLETGHGPVAIPEPK